MPDATIIIASRIGSGVLRKTLDSLTCQRTGRCIAGDGLGAGC